MGKCSPCNVVESREELVSLIDNTNLSPTLSIDEAEDFVLKSFEEGFYCAMIPPHHAGILASRGLGRYGRICTVYCFPYPFYGRDECVRGLSLLLRENISEVDVVAPLHLVRSGETELLEDHLRALADIISEAGSVGKLIVEVPLLDGRELEVLVDKAARAGFRWVKTSTGVISKGGDPYSVHRLYSVARNYKLKVKAAGGIRSFHDLASAIASGASRIGTSSGFRIVEQYSDICGLG